MVSTELDDLVVRVDFTLTFDEFQFWYSHLGAKHLQRRKFAWYGIALPGLVIIEAMMIGALIHDWLAGDLSKISWIGWCGIGVGVLSPVWALDRFRSHASKYRSYASKTWQAESEWRERQSCIFSASRVQFNCTGSSITVIWKHVVAVERAGPIYVFFNQNGGSIMVPARAFESDQDRRAFHQLAEAMVPNCKLHD